VKRGDKGGGLLQTNRCTEFHRGSAASDHPPSKGQPHHLMPPIRCCNGRGKLARPELEHPSTRRVGSSVTYIPRVPASGFLAALELHYNQGQELGSVEKS
jgi:hypothetical protein